MSYLDQNVKGQTWLELVTWYLNLPGTPNTSSEYYMECANDGFEKKKKIKDNF